MTDPDITDEDVDACVDRIGAELQLLEGEGVQPDAIISALVRLLAGVIVCGAEEVDRMAAFGATVACLGELIQDGEPA